MRGVLSYGVGLAVAQWRMKLSDGSCSIEDEPGGCPVGDEPFRRKLPNWR